jgi:RNA polymerase sigma-70 factor (ECF subfamily)
VTDTAGANAGCSPQIRPAGLVECEPDLIGAHRPELLRLAQRFCRNRAEAEDAVQNALLIAMDRRDQVKQADRALLWLKSIVVRQALELNRRAARRRFFEVRRPPVPDSAPAPGDVETDRLAETLRSLIQRLPERQRAAVILRHLEGSEYSTISELLSIRESTARVLVRKGREALRRLLERSGFDLRVFAAHARPEESRP